MINIPQNTQLKYLDIVVKYFFEYNKIVKTISPRSNGLHTGHFAIMLSMAQIIPPHEHNNYYVSIKCLQFQMFKLFDYICSVQTVSRDLNKLVKLGFLKKADTGFKFNTYQYNF